MSTFRSVCVALALLSGISSAADQTKAAVIENAHGVRLLVAAESTRPMLRVVLPGQPESDRAIEVIFPEHVTVRKHGHGEPEHLYLFRPGREGPAPAWRRSGQSLEYETELPEKVHMLARATLEDDGIRFRYEFSNQSTAAYDMIYAVTDPRLTGRFHDVRLERTYVHQRDGFDLLASESPERIKMRLEQWLPLRYLASFTWPVPPRRVERREDGVTYYNRSRAVDAPFIATLSRDRMWVIASFARQAGNVWSNPELTCQHVDPQSSLPPRGKAVLEVKLIVLRGSLDTAFQKAVQQRGSLQ